jgi:F420-0:gamma-glutamyl ligase
VGVKIVVLSDKETWDIEGEVIEITQEAFADLLSGLTNVRNLTHTEIINRDVIETFNPDLQ